MNENAKKFGLIAIIVIAVAAAVYGGSHLFGGGDKMEVVKTLPADPNFKSEKERSLEQQKQSGSTTAPATGKDADLGGDLGGR